MNLVDKSEIKYTPNLPLIVTGVFEEQIRSFFDTYDPNELKETLQTLVLAYVESDRITHNLASIRGEKVEMIFDLMDTLDTYEAIRLMR